MSDIPTRALGMMQHLAGAFANGEHPTGPERGIVDRDAALDAVMQLFAAIDEPLQAGTLDLNRGLHAMSMLMMVREYIAPLPDPPGDEALFHQDLTKLVGALRTAREQDGPS